MADIDWVLGVKMEELTGYTVKALRDKCYKGVFPQGLVWIKAPDGKILYSKKGYSKWARVSASALVKDHTGIELHGNRLRIHFTYKGVRCRELLKLPVTKSNIKYAAGLRATVIHEIETGVFDYRARFPDSPNARKFGRSDTLKHIELERFKEKYIKVKTVDIGPQTMRRYKVGIDQCIGILGKGMLISSLLPENIAEMRSDLIATRTPSTVNHYLAAFKGLLEFAYDNGYTEHQLFKGVQEV